MTASDDANTKITIAAEHLRAVTERVFGARGVSAADARFVTDVLVEANLRGHHSHGVARGRIVVARNRDERIPEGWAIGDQGRPTRDPDAALLGALPPAAGAKGFGLSIMVDLLAGALSGGARIYLPGEPEMECRSDRLEGGISIETDLPRELETLAGEAAA